MDELDLIRLAQSGHERALTELYQRYAPSAFKSAYLLTGNRSLAEDVVQETFIQVVRKIGTLRDPARFRPWLFQILTNAAKTAYRKRFWQRWLPLDLDTYDKPDRVTPSAQEQLEAYEGTRELREGIKQLKPDHRAVVVLHYFNGLPEQEIAEVLACPLGTVKSRLYHARQALQRMLTASGTGAGRVATPAVPSALPNQKG